MHQTNHLTKHRKNAFDKAIAQLLAELELSRKAMLTAICALKAGHNSSAVIIHLQNKLIELDEMKQKRG